MLSSTHPQGSFVCFNIVCLCLCVYVCVCVCVCVCALSHELTHTHTKVRLFVTPVDYGPPGSSVHGGFQARILEWVAMPSSRGSSQPGNRTHISCIASRSFTAEPPGKPCFSMTDGILWGELDLAHECVVAFPPDTMGSHQKGPASHKNDFIPSRLKACCGWPGSLSPA